MKKIFTFVFAAMVALAASSCIEELAPVEYVEGESVVATFCFDEIMTKTKDFYGKTIWTGGEEIWVSDGTNSAVVKVPEDAAGPVVKVEIPENVSNPLYAVYPATAQAGLKDGNIMVKVPSDQSGNFEEANICVAKSDDNFNFTMKNATAIMKVTAEPDIESIVLNAVSTDVLSGTLTVTYTDKDTPLAIAATASTRNVVSATIGGVDDTYYLAVIPGTYKAGFTAMALCLDGKSETKTTSADQILNINDITDLGTLGANLTGIAFEGDGSEGDPYIISNIGHMTVLATMVNNGITYAEKYFKMTDDITGVTTPIGCYNSQDYYFKGIFDGDGHTATMDINTESDCAGLFGNVGEGAQIHDLKLAGTVTTTQALAGGLAGCINAGKGVQVYNITNAAKVSGFREVGGIIGYADATTAGNLNIKDCTNNGEITATEQVGGILGYGSNIYISNCTNNAQVTSNSTQVNGYVNVATFAYTFVSGAAIKEWRLGVGGIAGWTNNGIVQECNNLGNVSGYMRVGGICGSTYWNPVSKCNNSGNITASGDFSNNPASQSGFCYGSCVGGIVGWVYTQGHITNCNNSGKIVGKGGQGGIVGLVQCGNNASSFPRIESCINSGAVISDKVYAGGISHQNPGTGGICGTLVCQKTSASKVVYPSVLYCKNTGNVNSTGRIVGGIVGQSYSYNNQLTTGTVINGCVNEGNVSGTYWIGGILGYAFNRFATYTTVKNCENHGKITGIRSDADGGVVVGGLVGAFYCNNSNYQMSNVNLALSNSYNTGDVVYTSKTFVKPYVGGVIGNVPYKADIQNCYNSGVYGCADGSTPAAGAEQYLGGIAGRQAGSFIKFCYFSEDTILTIGENKTGAVGTSGTAAEARVCTYDVDEVLSAVVTANNKECSTLLEALNEWQNYYVKNGYNNWKAGTDGPVLDSTTD